jgi:hypothetical protein
MLGLPSSYAKGNNESVAEYEYESCSLRSRVDLQVDTQWWSEYEVLFLQPA